MKMKKFTIVGATLLVILGCVLAAGCTSTTTTANDPILGTWGVSNTENEIGIEVATFLANGTGTEIRFYSTEERNTYPFTWKKVGDKTYHLTYTDGSVWEVVIVDDEQPLIWKCITNKEEIVGSWPDSYVENGEDISDETTFNPDFTGVSIGTYVNAPDKEKLNEKFVWGKIGDNNYILTYEDSGSRWIATYDPTTKSVSYTKVDYTGEPIIGTFSDGETEFNVDGTTTYTFAPNGTGLEVQTSEKGMKLGEYEFLWEKEGTNTYSLTYPSTTIWEFWTLKFNPQTKNLDDWNLEHYAWVDNYRTDGNHRLDIHFINENAGIAREFDGNGNMESYQTTWETLGLNTFKVTYEDGEVWYATYLPATGTYEWKPAAN